MFGIEFNNYEPCNQNPAFRLLPVGHKIKNYNKAINCWHDVTVYFLKLSYFTCQVYLVLQVSFQHLYWFWSHDNFVYKRFDQKCAKWKYTPPSEFCPISRQCSELSIPDSAWISLTKSYLMLQNAIYTAVTVYELLRENQYESKNIPTQVRFKDSLCKRNCRFFTLLFVHLAPYSSLFISLITNLFSPSVQTLNRYIIMRSICVQNWEWKRKIEIAVVHLFISSIPFMSSWLL